jgi:hypothetical protein
MEWTRPPPGQEDVVEWASREACQAGPRAVGPMAHQNEGRCAAARAGQPDRAGLSGSVCSAVRSTTVCPREDEMWRPGTSVRPASTLLPSFRWEHATIASTAGAHGPPPSRTSTSVSSAMRSWRWGTWPTGRLTQNQDLPDAATAVITCQTCRSRRWNACARGTALGPSPDSWGQGVWAGCRCSLARVLPSLCEELQKRTNGHDLQRSEAGITL